HLRCRPVQGMVAFRAHHPAARRALAPGRPRRGRALGNGPPRSLPPNGARSVAWDGQAQLTAGASKMRAMPTGRGIAVPIAVACGIMLAGDAAAYRYTITAPV